MSCIQYFWKWISMASTIPFRVAEIFFFLLTICGFAIKNIRPEWGLRIDKLAWQVPLGLLIATFLVSLAVSSFNLYQEQLKTINELNNELVVARKQAYPPITTLLAFDHFRGKDIPLGEFALINVRLQHKTFENCRIYGPAVVYLIKNVSILECNIDGTIDSALIITSNKFVSGVLAMEDVKFINCSFNNVSFIGNQETISAIKKMIEATRRYEKNPT